jgi:hypothetical protein
VRRAAVLPILLLVAAAASAAAVFAIHRIEKPGSPIGVPQVTPYFSPDANEVLDEAQVRFQLRERGTVTVTVLDEDGNEVRTLLDGRRVRGRQELTWDGTDEDGDQRTFGTFHVIIDLHGERSYEVRSPIEIDLTPPTAERARIDISRAETAGTVRVLVEGHRGGVERYLELDGKRLRTLRARRSIEAQRENSWKEFFLSAQLPENTTQEQARRIVLVLVDRAGNRLEKQLTVTTDELEPPRRAKR